MPTNPPADEIKVLDDMEVTQGQNVPVAYEDEPYVAGLRDLGEIIRDAKTANWLAVANVLRDAAAMIETRTLERDEARIASTIPDPAALDAAEARGRAAERADVVAWLRALPSANVGGNQLRINAIEAGEHLAKQARS